MAGREIVSVEGVAAPEQAASRAGENGQTHGSQCGYCTPGVVMSLFEGYYRGDIREPDQLDDQLCGNLCRCTGYRPIREAAIEAFPERHRKSGKDSFAERLKKATAELGAVEYEFAGERFFRPTSLGGLLQLLAQFPEAGSSPARPNWGSTSPSGSRSSPTLISVEAVPELKGIQLHRFRMAHRRRGHADANRGEDGGRVSGAGATCCGCSARARFATARRWAAISSPPRPSATAPRAAGARCQGGAGFAPKAGQAGRLRLLSRAHAADRRVLRRLPQDRVAAGRDSEDDHRAAVCRGPASRAIAPWYKVSKRREMDISTVAACFRVDLDRAVSCARRGWPTAAWRRCPSRARKTEEALLGKRWCEETVREVLPMLRASSRPFPMCAAVRNTGAG